MNVSPEVRKRAELLIPSAIAGATSLHEAMEKQFPIVLQVKLSDWNFFLTVASVFVAVTQLEQSSTSPLETSELLGIVTVQSDAWQPDAQRGFDDCKSFYEHNYDGLVSSPLYNGPDRRFLSADILGAWIVWNFFGHAAKSVEERNLVRALGTYVAGEFSRWWQA